MPRCGPSIEAWSAASGSAAWARPTANMARSKIGTDRRKRMGAIQAWVAVDNELIIAKLTVATRTWDQGGLHEDRPSRSASVRARARTSRRHLPLLPHAGGRARHARQFS